MGWRKSAERRGAPASSISNTRSPGLGGVSRDTHDIWHILTGYHRDGLGELCLVAFSYAQTKSLGWAFIAVGGALRALKEPGGKHAVKAIWQAYQTGKNAAWLPGEDFEALLGEPLESARARLNIGAPTFYNSIPASLREGTMAAVTA